MTEAETEDRWAEMCNVKTLQPGARARERWSPLPGRRAQWRPVSAGQAPLSAARAPLVPLRKTRRPGGSS
eukprot:6634274-Lingulodinium_polyedra.AAC.1